MSAWSCFVSLCAIIKAMQWRHWARFVNKYSKFGVGSYEPRSLVSHVSHNSPPNLGCLEYFPDHSGLGINLLLSCLPIQIKFKTTFVQHGVYISILWMQSSNWRALDSDLWVTGLLVCVLVCCETRICALTWNVCHSCAHTCTELYCNI